MIGADSVPVPLGKPVLVHDGTNDEQSYTFTVDCTSLANYASLTADNFIYEVTAVGGGGYDWGSHHVDITKTYDAATGTLTIKSGANDLSDTSKKAYTHTKGNVYCIPA